MNFQNLDPITRKIMLDEMTGDLHAGNLYFSNRLNDHGRVLYPVLLKEAIISGDASMLAARIRVEGCLKAMERRGKGIAQIPYNAHETLAEGEFNRYYIRALCRRAIEENRVLVVYRAKEVMSPRIESEMRIGRTIEAAILLNDLRNHIGVETALGIPAGPCSGLSVKFLSDDSTEELMPRKVA